MRLNAVREAAASREERAEVQGLDQSREDEDRGWEGTGIIIGADDAATS